MTIEFQDIKIVPLDDEASYKSDPSSALTNIILNLSASAPYEWSTYFNDRWIQQFYMMKRNASVSGKQLEIYCVPHELQTDHIPQLKKLIAETNQAYRECLARKQQIAATPATSDTDERKKLASIKADFKFD
ncbi:hypothetical protein EDF87_101543 [Pseudomonas helmanticensis]|uniref:Uncharacterized protein n=1 Tax=Pseudomonas helmanticensis TaxID=1471381 RepID=A0A4R7VV21_9PSED|nr:hypothetical protein [Pseudomonas helmanticensis]TDV53455.1 hypothetical protein EDF87_101543 [Pseudomonas helmanticensis]